MNPVMQALHERRSVRGYTAEPIDDATLDQLLDAAIWAPSAVNAQPWAFGIVRNRALLHRYSELAKAIYLADPPVPELPAMPELVLRHLRELVSQPGYDLFHGASTLVTIYATTIAGVADCFLAAENLMLAASSIGLGTCPIGLALPLMDQATTKNELGVPAGMVAALPIVVGHPTGQPPAPTRHPAKVLYRR